MKTTLYYISLYSEKWCVMFHWLNPITARMGLGYCHLADFSAWLDEKYDLGVWKVVKHDAEVKEE